MKANKETLMAVKRYITEHEGYDMDEVVTQMIEETNILHTAMENNKDVALGADDCTIIWGTETTSPEDVVCGLEDFVNAFSAKFIEYIANVLDSFVDDDIDSYLEEY